MTPEQHPTQQFDTPTPTPRPLAYSEAPDPDPDEILYTSPNEVLIARDRGHLEDLDLTRQPGQPGFNPHAAAWGDDRYPDPHPRTRPTRCAAGVDLLQFVAAALVTAIIAALVAVLGAFVANAATQRWTPASYWTGHGLSAPTISGVGAVVLSVGATLLAAAIMWLLLTATPAAGGFFCAIGVLVTAITMLLVVTSGPWQTTTGPAVVAGMVGTVIVSLTGRYAQHTTSRPDRF